MSRRFVSRFAAPLGARHRRVSRAAAPRASGAHRGPAGALGLVAAALLCVAGASATAQPADAGRAKAQACAACHGPLGIATAPDAPHLAGQPEIYVAAQLRAYRSGARAHPVMNVIAKPLSDADIAALAAWFAAVKIEATEP